MIEPRSARSIAFVTASPPGENGVGQNCMRDLVETIPDQHTHVFAILKNGEDWSLEDRKGIFGHHILERRYEHRKGAGPGSVNRISADLAFQLFTVRHAKRLADRIAERISESPVDVALVVMESPLLILVAERLVHRAGCPVSLLVWDHPDYVCAYFGQRGYSAERLRAAFARSCRGAISALTVSDALKRHITQLNPALPVELFRSPVCRSAPSASEPGYSDPSQFVIGFACMGMWDHVFDFDDGRKSVRDVIEEYRLEAFVSQN